MRYMLALLFVLSFSLPAIADDGDRDKGPYGGGFIDPKNPAAVMTTLQIQTAADDTYCVLEGFIVERATGPDAHERYVFKDDSGTVIVEIEDRVFAGRTITPQTKIRLYGEVEKENFRNNEVEVKRIEILSM
jgi:uncharacterized protein (TIGR00156 family)